MKKWISLFIFFVFLQASAQYSYTYTDPCTLQLKSVFVPAGGGGVAFTCNAVPMHSNIVKRHNNMNACFSCGFDVEDGHTSRTCPHDWRRANHQEAYDRNNAQQYIEAGYDPSTKAKHKTQLPSF